MRKEKLKELRDYINELKTIEVINSSDKPTFLSIEKKYYKLNNGKVIPREKLLKNGTDGSAAIILPITVDSNTILVVQPRVNTKETVGVELPAGYIEQTETPVLAAIRELTEETGYVPKKMKFLDSYYQDQGCMSAYNYSYLALDCKRVKKQNLDKDEFIKYFECRYEEALELVELGYIKDINSKYTLEKSKQYFKI